MVTRHPGVHFLKIRYILYYRVAEHVNKRNAGKPRVLAVNAFVHSLAALAVTFSAVAGYCYL